MVSAPAITHIHVCTSTLVSTSTECIPLPLAHRKYICIPNLNPTLNQNRLKTHSGSHKHRGTREHLHTQAKIPLEQSEVSRRMKEGET